MRIWTETHREGTDMGPIDWTHPTAKDMPEIWREAERNPEAFVVDTDATFGGGFQLLAVRMYDGWPYWEPRPALLIVGPMGSGEWRHFNSYGIYPNSIRRKARAA